MGDGTSPPNCIDLCTSSLFSSSNDDVDEKSEQVETDELVECLLSGIFNEVSLLLLLFEEERDDV